MATPVAIAAMVTGSMPATVLRADDSSERLVGPGVRGRLDARGGEPALVQQPFAVEVDHLGPPAGVAVAVLVLDLSRTLTRRISSIRPTPTSTLVFPALPQEVKDIDGGCELCSSGEEELAKGVPQCTAFTQIESGVESPLPCCLEADAASTTREPKSNFEMKCLQESLRWCEKDRSRWGRGHERNHRHGHCGTGSTPIKRRP